MKNISEIDKNFSLKTNIEKEDISFYNVKEKPFEVYGVFYEKGKFRRLPEEVAKTVNDGVCWLHANTSGGRVRFRTDSSYVAIHAEMPFVGKMPHFAMTGSAGFDLYIREEKEVYFKTFIPPFDITDGYESVIDFPSAEMREVTINFPLYSELSELYIGLDKNSSVEKASPYKNEKPIVFYGSSITQGGCASRPGLSYQSILSRRFDTDFINLGFSGSAKGETEIAEYIKNISMSVFVYDYDHNAPSVEHLRETHEKMFKIIREKNPELPVIMMSRPRCFLNEQEKERLEIIRKTYSNAVANGDKNVYFIDGKTLMKDTENGGTVDDAHPNDLGFYFMAKAVGDVLTDII